MSCVDCCTVCTPPFSCRRPRRPPRPQVLLLDRDVGGRKDEALGEVFIPIASFKEPKVVFHGSPSEAVRFGSGRCHRLSICIRVFSPLEADQFGSVWLGSARFGSVRFGWVRFSSVRFGSIRYSYSLLVPLFFRLILEARQL